MSNSHAWVLHVKPGYEREYQRRHDDLWPEMAKELDQAGITKYHIFRHGLTLFGYFECDDLAATQSFLAHSAMNAQWSEFMAPIMEIDLDPITDFPYLLPHMFAFENAQVDKNRE